MARFSTRLLLLFGFLAASSQARCFFRPYDFGWADTEQSTNYRFKGQLGYVSSFENAAPGLVEWYELYHEVLGLYYYTANAGTRKYILDQDSNWVNNFVNMWVFDSPGPDRVKLHEFYYAATGVHVWSTDPTEVDFLKGAPGWTYREEVATYLPTHGTNLYRYSTLDLST